MNLLVLPILYCGILNPRLDARQIFISPTYSNYLLYQDSDEEPKGKWQWGIQVGVANLIPKLGIEFSGALIRYDAPPEQGPYAYKYTPLTFTINFNILPFLKTSLIQMYIKTGFGLYLWQGLFNNQVITLPTGDKMDEKDLGFTGGMEFQIKPLDNLAIFSHLQYHYLTSSNIYKYGYFDKDEKFFVNGFGLKIFVP
ncbi:MAG: hypothetical protein N3A65_01075 [candidate division WOR-3 bacterium]|nr:hypothetical protein [candidate division WOR-3 bacterium]